MAMPAETNTPPASPALVASLKTEAALCIVSSSNTLRYVSQRIIDHGSDAAVIVNPKDSSVKGLVTAGDIVSCVATRGWKAPFLQVGKIVTAKGDVVRGKDRVSTALNKMLEKNVGHLPVVDMEGEVAGQLSVTSCLMAAIQRFGMGGPLTVGAILPEDPVVTSVTPEATLTSAAVSIAASKKPVMVLREGQIVGVVTPGRLVHALAESMDMENTTVAEAMEQFDAMPRDKTVADALREMDEKNTQHVLVGVEGRVEGVLSVLEIANALVGTVSRMEPTQRMAEVDHTEEEAENAAISSVPAMASGVEEGKVEEEDEEMEGAVPVAESCPDEDTVPVAECYSGGGEVELPEGYTDAVFVPWDRTVRDVAKNMASKRTDVAVVMRRGVVVGLITNHNLTRRMIAAERSPDDTAVGDVMTPVPAMATTTPAMSTGSDGARESNHGVEDSSGPKALSGSRDRRMIIGLGLAALAGIGVAMLARGGRR